ncbi:MAG: cell division protein FtsL [Lachnospiraceae bacterium]|nr:cell division protein FtsL [Candidatus Colinaster scatohippi]
MSNNQTRSNMRSSQRNYYVQGNVVRKAAPVRRNEAQIRRVEHAARKNRDKARYMNLGYVVFLTAAVLLVAVTLLGYLKMQSELTTSIKTVASLERELNDIKLSNDENLDRINSSINLENIKKIAVEELGMTYAKEGQVVVIESAGSDYVRQLKSLQ